MPAVLRAVDCCPEAVCLLDPLQSSCTMLQLSWESLEWAACWAWPHQHYHAVLPAGAAYNFASQSGCPALSVYILLLLVMSMASPKTWQSRYAAGIARPKSSWGSG